MKKLFYVFVVFALAAVLTITGCSCGGGQTMLLSAQLLGSSLELRVYGRDDDTILTQVSDVCKRADELFNPDNPDSELSLFNSSGGEDMTLSPDFLQLLRLSLYYYELSDGMLDITAARLDGLWDFKSPLPALPDSEDLADALENVGLENLSISAYSATLADGVTVGFGSLAKGYMLDKILTEIKNSGIAAATLKIDGNTVALGSEGKNGYELQLPFPFSENTEKLGSVYISDCTAVTLCADGSYFKLGDTLYHSFIDPETGYPAETDLYSVTVFADTPIRAYALAEICMREGLYKSLDLISKLTGVDAVFVNDRFEVRVSSGFTEKYQPDFNRAYTEHIQ